MPTICTNSPFRVNDIQCVSLEQPTPDTVVEALTKKAQRQTAYRLCEVTLDDNFEVCWSNDPMRFSTASIRRLCETIGIPFALLREESKRGTRCQRRILELVNDRIGSMDEGYTVVVDGSTIEGILSPKYKRLPNVDAASFVFDRLDMSAHLISRFRMEETRMAVDITSRRNDILPEQKALLQVGDPIRFGVSLFNSEDAEAAVDMAAFLERLRCLNGATTMDGNFGKSSVRHVGRHFFERFSTLLDYTQKSAATAFSNMLPMRATAISGEESSALHDFVAGSLGERMAVRVLADAAENANELAGAVSSTSKSDPLTTHAGNLISPYNVWNGITFQGHDAQSIDKRRKIEAFGGAFLKTWDSLVACN